MDWFRLEFQWAGTTFPDYWTPCRVEAGTNTLNRPDMTFLTRKELSDVISEIKTEDETENLRYRVYKIEMNLIEQGETKDDHSR